MKFTFATKDDFSFLDILDLHISEIELIKAIEQKRIYMVYKGKTFIGMLRYNFYMDNIPFVNFIYVKPKYRNNNIGSQILKKFEDDMIEKGYFNILTSIVYPMEAHAFFTKNNYKECGGFLIPSEPYELILYKTIKTPDVF